MKVTYTGTPEEIEQHEQKKEINENMDKFLPIFMLTAGFLVFVFVGIGIKILLKKDGEFGGTCASNNPMLNTEGEACGLCGASPTEKCAN